MLGDAGGSPEWRKVLARVEVPCLVQLLVPAHGKVGAVNASLIVGFVARAAEDRLVPEGVSEAPDMLMS